MQAKSIENRIVSYDDGMPAGRPKRSKETDFAERLAKLRQAAGFSQRGISARLGISQPSYAIWEQSNVSLRPDQIVDLCNVLEVSPDELFGVRTKRHSGPKGRAQRTFEVVSTLSKHRQKNILDVVDALIAQQTTET